MYLDDEQLLIFASVARKNAWKTLSDGTIMFDICAIDRLISQTHIGEYIFKHPAYKLKKYYFLKRFHCVHVGDMSNYTRNQLADYVEVVISCCVNSYKTKRDTPPPFNLRKWLSGVFGKR